MTLEEQIKALEAQVASNEIKAAEAKQEKDTIMQRAKSAEALTAKLNNDLKKAEEEKGSLSAVSAKAKKAIAAEKRAQILAGAIHEDVLSGAPELELDDDFNVDEASIAQLKKWREERSVLFEDKGKGPGPGVNTPPPGGAAAGSLTPEQIATVRRDDPKLYESPAYQTKVLEHFRAKSGEKK